ncbi:type II CAAX prenyl endopeptidase Rce1 family protein [Peptoniphilus sp.]|uniref:CPBP family glutamic-type intramembrane protease n=1 Tax=Peptoniphilus sp. TaxID=1971214 RepID=UPI0039BFFD05
MYYRANKLNEKYIVFIMAVPFGIIHLETVLMALFAIVGGFVLGLLYIKSKNLIYQIILNFIIDTDPIITGPILESIFKIVNVGDYVYPMAYLIMFLIFFVGYLIMRNILNRQSLKE